MCFVCSGYFVGQDPNKLAAAETQNNLVVDVQSNLVAVTQNNLVVDVQSNVEAVCVCSNHLFLYLSMLPF